MKKNMTRSQREEVIFAAVLFIISLVFTVQGFGFRQQAAIMPLFISIPLLLLTGIMLFRMLFTNFFETEMGKRKEESVPKLSEEIKIWLWVLGLLVGTILVGIVVAGSVFMFLFLIFVTGFKWIKSLIVTAITMGAIYTMFTVLLNIALYSGIFF